MVGIDDINDYYDVDLEYTRSAETGISREVEKWLTPVRSTKYLSYPFVPMNLEDWEQVTALFEREKFDNVCNLAAQAGVRNTLENLYACIDSNIVGFVKILEACRHHAIWHLVYDSSSTVYGNNTKMPLSISDNIDHPISLYATPGRALRSWHILQSSVRSHDCRTVGFFRCTVRGEDPRWVCFCLPKPYWKTAL